MILVPIAPFIRTISIFKKLFYTRYVGMYNTCGQRMFELWSLMGLTNLSPTDVYIFSGYR